MIKTPHKHATFIKAWADGETIERYCRTNETWYREFYPEWNDWIIYRIRDIDNGVCGYDSDPFETAIPGHR